jgi:hypothetical protein
MTWALLLLDRGTILSSPLSLKQSSRLSEQGMRSLSSLVSSNEFGSMGDHRSETRIGGGWL